MSQSFRASRNHWDLRASRNYFVAAIDSAMWRALAFARSFDSRSPWAARQFRRAVLVLWWTATFQIHIRVRCWARARMQRRIVPDSAPVPATDAIDPRSLDVPFSDNPAVSVIVPAHGHTPFTLRCLASIARHAPLLPIEVIVIDDASPWEDADALRLVRGIRLIRNDINLGFLHSCNKAAALAKGRYLYFLNNDTQVLDGWLDSMAALFRDWPGTGAVGAKLLSPDGRLQEAGGIIWRDASGWNFGRGNDSSLPAYNYVREVDYCSGAALMVERSVFAGLGGFDSRYAPAYFEDTDLCFRLRRMGLKTLYQPGARVVHHEGISHGRDTGSGIKASQTANQCIFAGIWADVLATGHYPNGENVFRARERSLGRKVLLAIDHYVPEPDRDAGSRAMMSCLHILLQCGYVVKFWPHNRGYSPGYTEVLQGMGIEVQYGPEPFETWIGANGGDIDTVLVSRPDVAASVLPAIRRHCRAPVVYYGHDLHFRRMRQQAAVAHDDRLLRLAEHMREQEYAIWKQADLSLYLSEEEAQIASALQPSAKIASVVPYCFDTFSEPRIAPGRQDIVFVAGFAHPPNEDAAIWFVTEILPLIRAEVPGAHFTIAGSNPSDPVRALAGEGVALLANVSDAGLAAIYDRARVAVVPLRCGAGVKLKVVESLRAGLPLVTTPVGAQGLPGLSQIVAVEDDPGQFAAAVVALLHDDNAWGECSRQQIAFARERFSRDAMTRSVRAALAMVA